MTFLAVVYIFVMVMLLQFAEVVAGDNCSCNTSAAWDALSALYDSTDGDSWKDHTHWRTYNSTVCEWHGVSCTELQLGNNRLRGTLPAALALFPSTTLLLLNLSRNFINGTLPPELSSMTYLIEFDVQYNNISGTLPAEYASWSKLERFFANHNLLSGTLPDNYSSWLNIADFMVKHNYRLTGTLPLSYAAWLYPRNFEVNANSFVGTLPSAYGRWVRMNLFVVSNNFLSGTLPPEYGDWRDVNEFSVFNNSLSGSLPSLYGQWGYRFSRLFAERNMLTGTLPAEYGNWTNVLTFSVSMNALSGTLPVAYKVWEGITTFTALSNFLTGTLPWQYHQWSTTIQTFHVYNNSFTGSLPAEYSEWRNVRDMSFGMNRLQGTIPPAYGSLTSLEGLSLDSNYLSGAVPPLSVQLALTLHNNSQLRGPLPKTMGATVAVSVCHTSLCGEKPPAWAFVVVVCQGIGGLDSSNAFESIKRLTPVPWSVPKSCVPATAVPQGTATAVVRASRKQQVLSVMAGIAGIVAAVATGGMPPTLVAGSLRVALVAQRVAKCNEDKDSPFDELAAVGALVSDSPTRLTIPGSLLPQTAGTVVGNLLVLLCVPLVVAAAAHVAAKWGKGVEVTTCAVTGAQCAMTAVFGSTVSAAVSLCFVSTSMIDAFVGSAGCVVCVAVVALVCVEYVQRRPFAGRRVQPIRRTTHNGVRSFIKKVLACLLQERSAWAALRNEEENGSLSLIRKWTGRMVWEMLNGCCYPHSWVLLYDLVSGVVLSALTGVASSYASCAVVTAALWAVFGLAVGQTCTACVLRPRATLGDCVFDVVMCAWSSSVALLAVLGVDEGSDVCSLAQAFASVAWSVPMRAAHWVSGGATPPPTSMPRDAQTGTLRAQQQDNRKRRNKRRRGSTRCLDIQSACSGLVMRCLAGETTNAEALRALVRLSCQKERVYDY